MQPYIPYHNCTTFNPYYSRNQETSHEQIGSPYHTDERFWGFGLLPFVGGLLLGSVGGYAIGNNNHHCYGKYCGGYPAAYPPQPYPQPYPYPYPYPVPVVEPIQYTSTENYYLQPVK